jgi:5-methyltetrahydropteroyltriglutamate--homocysteine methyltransferase
LGQGGYEPVADVLFGEVNVDAFFLEYDTDRAGDFRPLRHATKSKVIVLGLISTKTPELEPRDRLRSRIEEATKFISLERLALSPQCGFASNFLGNPVTVDDEVRKLELVVSVADQVWGTA